MHPMNLQVQETAYSKPTPITCTWDDFATSLEQRGFPYYPDKSNAVDKDKRLLPCFIPAELLSARRTKKNVLRVYLAVLDLDGISPTTLGNVVRWCTGHNAIIYSSWRCLLEQKKTGHYKVRVILPFSRPVLAEEWDRMFRALSYACPAPIDPQCSDESHLYFLPGCAKEDDPTKHFIWRFQGQSLDVDTLLATVMPGTVHSRQTTPGTCLEVKRDVLEGIKKQWCRSTNARKLQMGVALRDVLDGLPYASEGQRDNTTYALARELAQAIPNADPHSLASHFTRSITAMGAPTLEEVEEKLRRALDQAEEESERAALEQAEERTKRLQSQQRTSLYSNEELAALATASGGHLEHRWILQLGGQYYILSYTTDGPRYLRRSKDDISAALHQDLTPALSAGIILRDGLGDALPLGDIMARYGSVIDSYQPTISAHFDHYDPKTRCLYLAECPPRKLEPTYSNNVHRWLTALVGSDHIYNVCTWLANLTDLNRPAAALLITGPPGIGKSLLADGLAKIWRESGGPTPLEDAMGNFNASIALCPLLVGDEGIPKDFRGQHRTEELRALIASLSRPYRRKFARETEMPGAVRVILSANNENILNTNTHLSEDDVNAIAERFYHIPATQEAKTVLEDIGRDEVSTWVRYDIIAKHAAWLSTIPELRRSNLRFLIRNKGDTLARRLNIANNMRSLVCQWLHGYLENPQKLDIIPGLGTRVLENQLLTTSKGIYDNWGIYIPTEMQPKLAHVEQALGGLSRARRGVRVGHRVVQYRVVNAEILRIWADTYMGDTTVVDNLVRMSDTVDRRAN